MHTSEETKWNQLSLFIKIQIKCFQIHIWITYTKQFCISTNRDQYLYMGISAIQKEGEQLLLPKYHWIRNQCWFREICLVTHGTGNQCSNQGHRNQDSNQNMEFGCMKTCTSPKRFTSTYFHDTKCIDSQQTIAELTPFLTCTPRTSVLWKWRSKMPGLSLAVLRTQEKSLFIVS